MHYDFMQSEATRIKKELEQLDESIRILPMGKLIVAKNGKSSKWYISTEKGAKYLPKSERETAEQLALKRHLLQKRDYLEQESKAINYYLRHSPKRSLDERTIYNDEFMSLLGNQYSNFSSKAIKWINEPFESEAPYPENLIFKTKCGIMVRSKSETLIADALYDYKVPFRYEMPLRIGNQIIYPDFTTYNPKTDEKKYWEHFGMMDNGAYSENAFSKLNTYNKNGFLLGRTLIGTFETKGNPLTSDEVRRTIELYF